MRLSGKTAVITAGPPGLATPARCGLPWKGPRSWWSTSTSRGVAEVAAQIRQKVAGWPSTSGLT